MELISYYSKTITAIGTWIATLSSLFGECTSDSLFLVLGLLGLLIGVLGYIEILRTETLKRKILLDSCRSEIIATSIPKGK